MLHIEISKASKRKFDSSSGKEIEPNYCKDKKVSTGYLMSSYSKTSKNVFFSSQLRLKCLVKVFLINLEKDVLLNSQEGN